MRNELKLEIYPVKEKGKRRFNWRTRRNGEITAESRQGFESRAKAKNAFFAFVCSLAALAKL